MLASVASLATEKISNNRITICSVSRASDKDEALRGSLDEATKCICMHKLGTDYRTCTDGQIPNTCDHENANSRFARHIGVRGFYCGIEFRKDYPVDSEHR